MSLLAFLAEAVLISLSGVMAPGPITTITIGKGSESPHAGAWIAIGHGIVEFPLMVLILFGFGRLLNLPYVQAAIALVGGLFLAMMAVGMLRSANQPVVANVRDNRSPVMAGILLTLGNPYFLVWWATLGATLALRAISFGWPALVAFGLAHWLCDLGWSYFLSALSFKGRQFFGNSFQKAVFALCGLLLFFFSGKLLLEVARMLA